MEPVTKKMVYYDALGARHTRLVSEVLLHKIMRLFDGNQRAVSRTTGGLGLAMPVGIKFDVPGGTPVTNLDEIFIQLNCTEFSSENKSVLTSAINRPKLLSLSKVQEGFDFTIQESQRYVVDLGEGIVPIRVIRFFKTHTGQEMVGFLEQRESDLLFNSEHAESSIQVYWLPRECLRWARQPGSDRPHLQDEFKLAQDRYRTLLAAKHSVFPKWLRLGERLSVPSGSVSIEFLERLTASAYRQHQGQKQSSEDTLVIGSEGLISFGLFEATSSTIQGIKR